MFREKATPAGAAHGERSQEVEDAVGQRERSGRADGTEPAASAGERRAERRPTAAMTAALPRVQAMSFFTGRMRAFDQDWGSPGLGAAAPSAGLGAAASPREPA